MKTALRLFTTVITICLLNFTAEAQDALISENILFPADAGIINVTAAPYNADKTGATGATAAMQAAID